MSLELYASKDLSEPLLCEISEFLDSQETSHPFQFPQWNARRARFAVLREGGAIRWFGRFRNAFPVWCFSALDASGGRESRTGLRRYPVMADGD